MPVNHSVIDRHSAVRQNKAHFACGYAISSHSKHDSRMEAVMPITMACALFSFVYAVRCGKNPAEAFAAINWPSSPDGPGI